MNYKEFKKEIETNIKKYLPEKYQTLETEIRDIPKNNDSMHSALSFVSIGDSIARLLYLEGAYEEYCNTSNMENILKKVAQFIVDSLSETVVFNPAMVTDFQTAQNQIVLKLINENSNQEQLQSIPYHKVDNTDLVAIYRIDVSLDSTEGFIIVNNEMLKAWGVDENDLYERALENTQQKYPYTLKSMEDVIKEIMLGIPTEVTPNQLPTEMEPHIQYVLTNKESINGATCILYPNLLKEIGATYDSNFFVLPSSTHELILIKDTGEMSASELQRMVIDVNITQVAPEDLLSHHVYGYDQKENTLTMGTTKEETMELLASLSPFTDGNQSHDNEQDMERE